MQITDVRTRRKKMVQLYIDGEAAVQLSAEIWDRSGLTPGCNIEDEQLRALLEESQRYLAREKALYLLEYRPHSKRELENKISRTLTREAAKEAVEKLEELGLTDDARYAENYARMLIERKGYAPKRAIYELGLKGIDRETAQMAVDSVPVDITENIQKIIAKKYPQIEDEKVRGRAVQALQRLGYSFGQIRRVLGILDNTEF